MEIADGAREKSKIGKFSMKMFKNSLLAGILLFFPYNIFAETIILKSGEKIEAKIIERNDKSIKVDFDGIPLTYYIEDIESINKEKTAQSSQSVSISTLDIEKTASQIFKEVSPAVVVISTSSIGNIPEGIGTGFVIDKKGIIVTCLHVIRYAQDMKVRTKDDKFLPVAGIIAFDPIKDICILKVDANDLTAVTLGNIEKLEIGAKLYTIGTPLSLSFSLSDGLLSGYRSLFSSKLMQFTAPVSPGNSGGPIINAYGNVVGIATASQKSGQNLNFGIPLDEEVKNFIKNAIDNSSEKTMKNNLDNFKNISNYLTAAIESDKKWYDKFPNTQECVLRGGCNDDNCNLSIENYEKAINTGYNYPGVYQQIGFFYASCERNFDKAIFYIKKAVEIDMSDQYIELLFDMNITKIESLLSANKQQEAKISYLNFINDLKELSSLFPDLISAMKTKSATLFNKYDNLFGQK